MLICLVQTLRVFNFRGGQSSEACGDELTILVKWDLSWYLKNKNLYGRRKWCFFFFLILSFLKPLSFLCFSVPDQARERLNSSVIYVTCKAYWQLSYLTCCHLRYGHIALEILFSLTCHEYTKLSLTSRPLDREATLKILESCFPSSQKTFSLSPGKKLAY